VAESPLKFPPVRAFLGIPLYKIFPQEIETLLKPLGREIPGVRWAEPKQVHLTLHFFGPIAAREIDLIDAFSKKIATLFSPLELTLGPIGGFPSLEKPDILWLGVREKTGRLRSLQKAVHGEARTLGFRTETRPFEPHATIGRVKRKNADPGPLLARKVPVSPGPAKVADYFVLYQSHCRPEGARYEVLKTYPLSKKA
jgi:2'-5' RNA ligase